MSFTTKIQFLAVCFHLQDFVAYGNAYGNSSWRHVESENISVLTISGNSRNVKIIVPYPPFYYHPPPANLWYSLNIPWGSFYYDPAILRYFSWTPTSLLIRPPYNQAQKSICFRATVLIICMLLSTTWLLTKNCILKEAWPWIKVRTNLKTKLKVLQF